jgi:hypothetical protein
LIDYAGGFGTVFLVQEIPAGLGAAAAASPSGNAGKTYALKQMICQSKEQVNPELRGQRFAYYKLNETQCQRFY